MSPNEKVLKLTTENENLIKNLNFKAKTESNLKSKLENATFKMNVSISTKIYVKLKIFYKNLKQELLKIRFALTNPVNTARLRSKISFYGNFFKKAIINRLYY